MKNMYFSLFCKFLRYAIHLRWSESSIRVQMIYLCRTVCSDEDRLSCSAAAPLFRFAVKYSHFIWRCQTPCVCHQLPWFLPSETFIRAEKLILATFLFLGNIKLFLINPVDIFGYWHCSLKYKIYGHKAAFWRNLS